MATTHVPHQGKVLSKTAKKDLLRLFRNATDEKQVEDAYHSFLKKIVPKDFRVETNVQGILTDGYFSADTVDLFDNNGSLVILLEAKWKRDFSNVVDRASTLAQAIYYSHNLIQVGRNKPTIYVLGDEDQMFILYAPHFDAYLEENPDDPHWKIPAHNAASNTTLMKRLVADPNLNTLIYDLHDTDFDFNDVANRLMNLHFNSGELKKIEITEHNIRTLIEKFILNVNLKKPRSVSEEDWARMKVSIFTNAITGNPQQNLLGSSNKLSTVSGIEVAVDHNGWTRFFDIYEKVTDLDSCNQFRAISEGLVPEVARRNSGDYWTPTVWVDRAHTLVSELYGDDWRSKYTVWDAAWGTGNLTRDYSFKSLYASTLFQSEFDIASQINNNAATTKFQYDFLNDDPDLKPGGKVTPQGVIKPEYVNDTEAISQAMLSGNSASIYYKIPGSLYEDLENPDIDFCWLMNPPYGRPGNPDKKATGAKVTKTAVQSMIQNDPVYKGQYANNLYSQFFYRVLKIIKDFKKDKSFIASFSNSQFMCGGAFWTPLIELFENSHQFQDGFLLHASEFADTGNNWGIAFSVWGPKSATATKAQTYPISIERLSETGIEVIGTHSLRSVDAKDQIKYLIPVKKTKDVQGYRTNTAGALQKVTWKNGEDAIGAISFHSQNVEQVNRYTWIDNININKSVPITRDTYKYACGVLAFCRSVPLTWWQNKDNFQLPSETIRKSPEFQQFLNDSIVIALLEEQRAYRDYPELPDGSITRGNEWFWLTQDEVKQSLTQNGANDILLDLQNNKPLSGERFIAQELQNIDLSDDAKYLLQLMKEIWEYTLPHRELDSASFSDASLVAWDAGWKQIMQSVSRRIAQSGPNQNFYEKELYALYRKFVESRRLLLQRINRLVYEWGVLVEPDMVPEPTIEVVD